MEDCFIKMGKKYLSIKIPRGFYPAKIMQIPSISKGLVIFERKRKRKR